MNLIEEKLAEIIEENSTADAAKLMFSIMKDCVCAEIITTEESIHQTVDQMIDWACEEHFG